MVLFDSLNDVLLACVEACGGNKVVGAALWPKKDVEVAAKHLAACLNPARNEKLSPDEVLIVARIARDADCHLYVRYLAQALSYTKPEPVEPGDELRELMRASNELQRQQLAMAERMERLLTRTNIKLKA